MTNIEAILRGAKFWNSWTLENPNPKNYDFSGADLTGLDLYDLDARPPKEYYIINLRNTNFENCILTNSNFRLANLSGANFRNAKLSGSEFSKNLCDNADFTRADLRECDFARAKVNSTLFRGADLTSAGFRISGGIDFDLTDAMINHLKVMEFYPMLNSLLGARFFQLLFARGLHLVHKNSRKFVLDYIDKAFNEIHMERSFAKHEITRPDGSSLVEELPFQMAESPEFIQEILKRVEALHPVFQTQKTPLQLVEISNRINKEIIQYLSKNPSALYKLHWRSFENLIAEILQSFGWQVEVTSATKDGGYDIFGVVRDISGLKQTWIIECKHWQPDRKVGIETVRALYAVKNEFKVGNALLATTSLLTEGVEKFKASRYDFSTKDFDGIVEWINAYSEKVPST